MNRRRGASLARLLGVARLLGGARRALRVAEIAEELGVGWRTVYRDLDALQEAGYPVAMTRRGGTSYWSFLPEKGAVAPALDAEEALVLALAADHLDYLDGTGLPASVRAIRARLAGSRGDRSSAIAGPRRIAVPRYERTPIFATLRRAAERRRVVRCRYFTLSRGVETERCIHPYRIWLSGATVYVVAHCETRKQVLMFHLDRFRAARDDARSFPEPSFDLDEYLRGALRAMRGGAERDVVLHLDAWAALRVKEQPVHATQRLEPLSRGGALLRVRVVLSPELVAFVLGLGSHASPFEPAQLVTMVADELAAMQAGIRQADDVASTQLLLFPPPPARATDRVSLSRFDKRPS